MMRKFLFLLFVTFAMGASANASSLKEFEKAASEAKGGPIEFTVFIGDDLWERRGRYSKPNSEGGGAGASVFDEFNENEYLGERDLIFLRKETTKKLTKAFKKNKIELVEDDGPYVLHVFIEKAKPTFQTAEQKKKRAAIVNSQQLGGASITAKLYRRSDVSLIAEAEYSRYETHLDLDGRPHTWRDAITAINGFSTRMGKALSNK